MENNCLKNMLREQIIIKYIKEKDVLDIGSVGQTGKYNLWNFLKKNSGKLTGIDVEISNNSCVVHENMENYNFNKQFDVIIAGDVLEHVDNQGLFLENINKHLKKNGRFILTTPNAKWLTVIFAPNKTHTCWHDKYTLRYILEKFGFQILNFKYYIGNKRYYNFFKKILVLRQGMLVVCKK